MANAAFKKKQIWLKIKENTIKILHLEHNFVW